MAMTPPPDAGEDEDWGEQLFEAGLEFADNPEPRCPCVLLLDTSGSMKGERIAALNAGLRTFRDELTRDALASRRVEVAVVAFGGDVRVVQEFVTVDDFHPPELEAGGLTPMGSAIDRALDLLDVRKGQYKASGVAYYRPWVFLITDGAPEGEPDDVIHRAARRVRTEEAAGRVAFFAVGVEGADLDQLAELTTRPPCQLCGLRFVDLFVWLSRSTQQVAHSRVGDQVALPPVDWGTV
jgi:uncharacterized protein YegL